MPDQLDDTEPQEFKSSSGPDPNTKQPLLTPPPRACDCHVHVYGPHAQFPFLPDYIERSCEAPKDALERMHRITGIDRCVVVHVPAHGLDLSVTLDAMGNSEREVRAIALINKDITNARLKELHEFGVRGIRYSPSLDGGPLDHSVVRRMADRIGPFGWHILLHFKDSAILEYSDLLDELPVPFVLDHFGSIDPAKGGINQETFRLVLEHLTKGNGWIKISAIEKVSHQNYPFNDAAEIAKALITRAPNRVLWGTDWPHPGLGIQDPTNDGDLVDLIPTYAHSPEVQQKILVDNPAILYGFG